jgi:ribosome-associated translation inhibitor RaiA
MVKKNVNKTIKDLDITVDFKAYLNEKLESLQTLKIEDLKSVILFLEYQVMCMSLELKTIERIEIEKESILEAEELSDEDLQEKFDELAEYLQTRVAHFDEMHQNFQDAFDHIVSPTASKFIEQYTHKEDLLGDDDALKINKTH